MKESLPTHRIAIEPRGGRNAIWLLFYETLYSGFYIGFYTQQLLRICKNRYSADKYAYLEKKKRGMDMLGEIIVRDDKQRDQRLRIG